MTSSVEGSAAIKLDLSALPNLYDREKLRNTQAAEEILKPNPSRWVILPIRFPSIWALFKSHEHDFWTAEDMEYNVVSRTSMHDTVVNFAAYEAASDAELYGCLATTTCTLLEEVQIPEARAFYGFECAFNTIQREAMAHAYNCLEMPDEDKKTPNVLSFPEVDAKAKWAKETVLKEDCPFAEKLLQHAIQKTIFNAGRCVLANWLERKEQYPSVKRAFTRCSKTDQLHALFAAECYKLLANKLPASAFRSHLQIAVDIEKNFCTRMLPLTEMQIEKSAIDEFLAFVRQSICAAFGEQTQTETQTGVPNPFRAEMPDVLCVPACHSD